MEENVIIAVLLGSLFLFLILIAVGIINYFLQAVGLYKLAKRKDIEFAWLSWIPFANIFVMPMLVEDKVHEFLRDKYTLVFVFMMVVSSLLGVFVAFFSLIPILLVYYTFYFIADTYSKRSILHLIVAVITLGLTMPLQLFVLRNRNEIDTVEVI